MRTRMTKATSMKVLARAVSVLAVLMFLGVSPLLAQETRTSPEFNVTVTMPDGWIEADNERSVFNFRHDESSTQIELIATELVTAELAVTFFNHFHTTLTASDFAQTGREELAYGTISGIETIYNYTHGSVDLKVVVFEFVEDATAWLVVSYVDAEIFDDHVDAYRAMVANMRFGG